MQDAELAVVYSKECIEKRIEELAQGINEAYKNKKLVMICMLKGAFMFFSDLIKHVDVKPEIDFIRLSSYGNFSTSGEIKLIKDVEISLTDKEVLIVEDIVDTGNTIKYIERLLFTKGANSVKFIALIDKIERRKFPLSVDYIGFKVDKGFLVGYGLDYAEKYRELPEIYEILL